jgi:DNA polymerase
MPVSGKGELGILIVGEAPGEFEDEQGRQFVGKSGALLKQTLSDLGVDMRRDCWLTNALICRPPKNRTPDEKEIGYCRPNLMATLAALNPQVVITLGGTAAKSLLGSIWKEAVGPITRWVGWNIPYQKRNVWICPTYHPSFILRDSNKINEMFFKKHLAAAVAHTSRPWEEIPTWTTRVEVLFDTTEAARRLRAITEEGGPCAVDYENTCLKPEYEGAEIVCCSVSHKGQAFAYPWHGDAIAATGQLLVSPKVAKIASNLKHEDRWSRWAFGRPVVNWLHDTMIAAHTLDNRPGITGLKFQSFVQFGVESYDDHIKPFLQATDGGHINRIKQVDPKDLLKYCAWDSFLEEKLALKQRKQFKALA